MIRIVLIAGLCTACSATRIPGTGYNVSGQITHTSSYCGGAYPDEDILEYHRTPRPATNMLFYIRKGDTNNPREPITDSIRTDHDGRFHLTLPAGTYAVILPEQLNREILNRYTNDPDDEIYLKDTACLENWWKKAWQVLVVENDSVNVTYTFHKRCFLPDHIPCLEYSGPYPP